MERYQGHGRVNRSWKCILEPWASNREGPAAKCSVLLRYDTRKTIVGSSGVNMGLRSKPLLMVLRLTRLQCRTDSYTGFKILCSTESQCNELKTGLMWSVIALVSEFWTLKLWRICFSDTKHEGITIIRWLATTALTSSAHIAIGIVCPIPWMQMRRFTNGSYVIMEEHRIWTCYTHITWALSALST